MKATIRIVLCATAAMLAAVSCQKSGEAAGSLVEERGTIDIRIGGLMGEYSQVDGTKAELVNTVRVSWKGGEIVYVFDGTQCLGSLKATLEDEEDRYALLSTDETHTVKTPAGGTTKLTLVYSPLLDAEPAVSSNAISISLANQNSAKAPFVVFATLDYSGATTITDAVVPFKFATSVIKVNCTGLKASTAITSATLSNVNTACKLTLFGTDATTITGDANGTIVKTGDDYFAAGKVNAEGEAVFQIAVPKLETASEARVLTVAQGSDVVKDKNFSKKAIDPATSVNTVCQLVGLHALKGEFSVGPNATDKVRFSKGNLYAQKIGDNWTWNFYDEQYKYNSIATSSGKRTASDTDAEIDLFTWGHDNTSTNTSYSLNPVNTAGISEHTTDGGTFSSSEDWGHVFGGESSVWRTLTSAEWQYLFSTRSNASSLYKYGVTVCGRTHCVVLLPDDWQWDASTVGTRWQTEYPEIATESNPVTWQKMEDAGAVCLPAAGHREGSGVNLVGDVGKYWSSTAGDSGRAYVLFFLGNYTVPSVRESRSYGISVRLIIESK